MRPRCAAACRRWRGCTCAACWLARPSACCCPSWQCALAWCASMSFTHDRCPGLWSRVRVCRSLAQCGGINSSRSTAAGAGVRVHLGFGSAAESHRAGLNSWPSRASGAQQACLDQRAARQTCGNPPSAATAISCRSPGRRRRSPGRPRCAGRSKRGARARAPRGCARGAAGPVRRDVRGPLGTRRTGRRRAGRAPGRRARRAAQPARAGAAAAAGAAARA